MNEMERVRKVGGAREAPLLMVGAAEFEGGYLLGRSVVQGAAVMVELIHPNGTVIGYICSALVDEFCIKPGHISSLAS
jgi:hypothetical protein